MSADLHVQRAFRAACAAVDGAFDDRRPVSDYPRQIRVLAGAGLARSNTMTSKAAAKACAVGDQSALSPSQMDKASVTAAMIGQVIDFLRSPTSTSSAPSAPPAPPLTAPVATPSLKPAKAHRSTVSRFAARHAEPDRVNPLPTNHPAAVEGRTLFPTQVVGTMESPRFLISGHNNPKLGKEVLKGPRKGWPIFQLSLEERATCPRSCTQWLTCYGDAMPCARRHRVDDGFMGALRSEVLTVARANPGGLLIRLHALGDFYSVEYVLLWAELLAQLPQLHVFGYTARRADDADPASAKIATAIGYLTSSFWDRFSIRTSHAEPGPERTIVVSADPELPDVIVCPAQTGGTEACATCGLCWADAARDKTVAFLQHGRKKRGAADQTRWSSFEGPPPARAKLAKTVRHSVATAVPADPAAILNGPLDGPEAGWSANRIAFLRATVAAGWSAGEAAVKLRTTRNGALGKAVRLGLRFNSDGRSAGAGRAGASLPQGARRRIASRALPSIEPKPRAAPTPGVEPTPGPAPAPTLRSDGYRPRVVAVPEEARPCELIDLGLGQCRWPLDDPGPGQMHKTLFCAAPAAGCYCASHNAAAFHPTPAKGRKSMNELARSLRRYA
jgi:hypothetical protein